MSLEKLDIKEPDSEQNAVTQSVVTEITSATTDAVIEIVPAIDPTLETETEVNVPDSNTGTQPRAVVTEVNDGNATGKMGNVSKNTQQKISEDYEVPEEIASVALLMLQEMSQPNTQDPDNNDNDEYALLVGTERLPDIVSEMNEERGIRNVVNYDAEIPEDMRLQIDELRLNPDEPKRGTHDEADKEDESDETIIYDASEFDDTNKGIQKPDNTHTDEGEKTPKGQLRTQTYGIIKWKPTSRRTFTCIECGAKRKSKQDINRHYREKHSSIKCPDCDKVFPTPDSLQRHRYVHSARDKFICDKCGKEYPFESDLNRHKIKHRNKEIKTHVCIAAGCEQSFMRKADLVSHAQNHSGKVHKCDQCNYSATDIRYLKQHQRKHSNDLQIKCNICNCGFRYYTQMKWHRDNDH